MSYLTTIEHEKNPNNSGSAPVPLLSGTQLIGDVLLGVTSDGWRKQLKRSWGDGKSGNPHIWAPTSELGPRTVDLKRTASRVKLIALP